MALPKKRTSKSRKNKRRTHWKLNEKSLVECSRCHEMKLPHRVCPECGYYNGKPVISITSKKEKSK